MSYVNASAQNRSDLAAAFRAAVTALVDLPDADFAEVELKPSPDLVVQVKTRPAPTVGS